MLRGKMSSRSAVLKRRTVHQSEMVVEKRGAIGGPADWVGCMGRGKGGGGAVHDGRGKTGSQKNYRENP